MPSQSNPRIRELSKVRERGQLPTVILVGSNLNPIWLIVMIILRDERGKLVLLLLVKIELPPLAQYPKPDFLILKRA